MRTHQKQGAMVMRCAIITLSLFVGLHAAFAKPVVRIALDPNITTMTLAKKPQKIRLNAQVSASNMKYAWKIEGPGTFKGDATNPGILYIPPENIEGRSAQVVLTVTVTDSATGEQNRDRITLTLLAPEETQRQTAQLTVRSNVRDDLVWIDGTRYQATPVNVELPVGTHQIRIEKEDCEPYETTISLQQDDTVRGTLSCQQPTSPEPSSSASCWENETQGATCKEEKTGMEFVYMPGGCFMMGQTDQEKAQLIKEVGEENYTSSYADELPRHKVCVHKDSGFWMGKYEVTNAQYRRFKAGHPNYESEGKSLYNDNQPVVMISWDEAQKFVEWLNVRAGSPRPSQGATNQGAATAPLRFRLPTEAEWEYAARGGTETIRYWGDDPKHTQACQYANVGDSVFAAAFPWVEQWKKDYKWFAHSCDDGYAVTAPVGQFAPNAFGLYDMLGNVREWCQDSYASYTDTPTDGSAYRSKGDKKAMVLRGGSWYYLPYFVRSSFRSRHDPADQYDSIGFRVAVSRTP